MRVGLIENELFLRHQTGRSHPEHPVRLEAVREALREADLLEQMASIDFSAADLSQVASVHEPAYVELIRLACERGFAFVGSEDTRISPESYDVALLAAGGVTAACDAVVDGAVRRAFCAVRPPGHHAEPDRALGFCLFNHVAIGAAHLVDRQGLERVAVVDFDAHHGNGTQRIFEARGDVLYISVHEHPDSLPFPGTGREGETGRGPGKGFTLNLPLRFGAEDADYREAFETQVLPRLEDYRPQFVMLSAGFDAARDDPVSHLALDPSSYGWMTADLVDVAERHGGGRLVSVLEGGYAISSLKRSVVAHVRALAD